MATQPTGTIGSQQSTLAPVAANGADTSVQAQVQQPQAQPAPTGIAGAGQSTIAQASSNNLDLTGLSLNAPNPWSQTPDDDEPRMIGIPFPSDPQQLPASVKFLLELDNYMTPQEQLAFFKMSGLDAIDLPEQPAHPQTGNPATSAAGSNANQAQPQQQTQPAAIGPQSPGQSTIPQAAVGYAASNLVTSPNPLMGALQGVVKMLQAEQAQPAANGTGSAQPAQAKPFSAEEEEYLREFQNGMRAAQDPSYHALLFANSPQGLQIKLDSELERAVTAVITALHNKGFSNLGIEKAVNEAFKYCRAFTGAEIRSESVYVDGACFNAGCYCPEVSTADIRLYAASRGYKLEVSEKGENGAVKRYCRVKETLSRDDLAALLKSANPDDGKQPAKPDDGKKA